MARCGSTATSTGEPCQQPVSSPTASCWREGHGDLDDLTHKQRRFVEEYTVDFNATQAAIRAGYSENCAGEIGYENLNKPQITSAVERRMDELAMTADEALRRLAEWGRGDVGELIEIRDDGLWQIDLKRAEKEGKLHLIKELSYDSNGLPKLKLYDAKDAVKQIAKVHGLFVDRLEHSGPEGGPIEVDVDDARERLDRRVARIAERRRAASGAQSANGSGS